MTTKTGLLAGGAVLPATLFNNPGAAMLLRGPGVAMSPPDAGGEGGGDDAPMTREAAMEVIRDAPPVDSAPVQAAPAEGEQPTESEAAPTAEGVEGQGDQPPVGEEAEIDPEAPAIDFPRSWDAKGREVFASLPDEAKAIVLARENARDTAVSRAQSEASQKVAAEVTKLNTELRPQFEAVLDRANKYFAETYDGITEADWARWAEEDPTATFKLRTRYDADRAQKAAIQQVVEQQRQQEIQTFVADEFAKLPEVAPDLVDPKEGAARRQSLAKFLLETGVVGSVDQLPNVSAVEMSLAYDAMRYRQLKAAPPAATPQNQPAQGRPPVRPGAAVPRSPSNDFDRAKNRFAQTGRREDAVEVIKRMGI
jgi:hypothetical protein